ncbi:hypothetical protein ASPZODRAFT_1610676 [Penicilliopsis zonata CBS 506.65]|uniref:Conserved oligomeric Golgi complex subunit 2 n=1 Tax=Penicilliopsis zonata CBS 506.65 TaxID=1073090 RepID=A0A1L9SMK8_9EURO|nr:hypothetical protein ASPZODRAFT_1610676 [Penicilliopsis zonata CBS 506.65]OJJ48499.1 hypothetical protein ASPZODRAFT_1610676 [Penicilliopsis zonata CBS 506.65]
MSNLPQFGDSDRSSSDFDDDDDDDTSSLPFPEPLARSFFLAPDFDPAAFLSSLRNRHQSLEDLRQELRSLDQLLSKELLDLVNENYQDFLSLGSALRGGEEKTEEVRVGLLAFQRDVRAIRDKIEDQRADVEALLKEKKRLRSEANIGKLLLDYADRVEELEQRLMIGDLSTGDHQQESDSEASDPEMGLYSSDSEGSEDASVAESSPVPAAPAVSLKRLEHHIRKFLYLTTLTDRIGSSHPFLLSQQPRMENIRSTLLLDLKSALGQTQNATDKQEARTMAVMKMYNLMGEEVSTATALKDLKI